MRAAYFWKKVKQFRILSILETSKESSLAIPECLKKKQTKGHKNREFFPKSAKWIISVIPASFSLKRKIIKISIILSCGEGICFKFGGIFVNVLFLKVSNLIYSHDGKRKKQQQKQNLKNMKCLPKKPW